MHFFNHNYKNTIKPDFLIKFKYKNIFLTPKIEKIILNFGIKEVNFKNLLPTLASLELITNQKAALTCSKMANISLKIRKGVPVGCKVTLRKVNMSLFLTKLILLIFPTIKLFEGIIFKKSIEQYKSFSFCLDEALIFSELEHQYDLFKSLPKLDISITTHVNSIQELNNLLTSYRFPVKIVCESNSTVECNLAKVEVEGSNPFFRLNFMGK
jgi:large subunit ribosomal protein L5